MEDVIEKHEKAIVDYYDSLMYEIFEKILKKHNVDVEDCLTSMEEKKALTEIDGINLIKTIFSAYNLLGLFTMDAVESLEKLQTEVNDLRKCFIDQDKELARSLEVISGIAQKIIDDYYLDVELEKLETEYRSVQSRPAEMTKASHKSLPEDKDPEAAAERVRELQERLEFYTISFIEHIELIFTKAKKYLDGGDIEVELSSTISKVIDFCSDIDSLKQVGFLTKELSIFFGKRKVKNVAKLPATIIRPCAGKENRPILTKGAYKIFSHYEHQFDNLPWNRHVNKVASDSAYRLISYLLKNPTITKIKSEDILKGIVEGTSPLNPSKLFCKRGRTIRAFGSDMSTESFFTGAGKCEIVGDKLVHYIAEDTLYDHDRKFCELGFRLKLPWEELSKCRITDTDEVYSYKYIKEKELEQITKIYEKLNPDCKYVETEK